MPLVPRDKSHPPLIRALPKDHFLKPVYQTQFTKTGKKCRVTFKLPAEVNAETAVLCGDFNEWGVDANPMKKLKEEAKEQKKLIDVTEGRKTRSIILLDSDHVVLSAVQPETINMRFLPLEEMKEEGRER